MRVVRKTMPQSLVPATNTDCPNTVTNSESYSKFNETRTEKDGWTIIRGYSESKNCFNDQQSFYASHNTQRDKEGMMEYINRSYSNNNGIVTVSYSKGYSRTYKECDMSFEDWQFDMDFED